MELRSSALRGLVGVALVTGVLSGCDAARRLEAGSSAATCTRCHGGLLDQSGAPPFDTAGRIDPSLPSVGAHAAHVAAGFDCDTCHVKPVRDDVGHVDGIARLAWSRFATGNGTRTPTYDRESHACASVYCHGGFPGGNASNAPRWTGAARGDAACGTCHGLPPPAPHPRVPGALAGCHTCHPDTVTADGDLDRRARAHADGVVDVTGGHDSGWMDRSGPRFHAFEANAGIASCQGCHGADLSGGSTGVGCGGCHDRALPAGVASWRANCVMCHGAVEDGTGAPPKATWGHAGEPERGGGVADAVRVGAHSAHLAATALSPGFDCDACHVKPDDALAPGHLDGGAAEVTFAGIAVSGVGAAPAWDRATATCASTYCHGGNMGGAAPRWTDAGEGRAGCGTCHGLPPPEPHPRVAASLSGCGVCHEATVDVTGALVRPSDGGGHLNGRLDGGDHGVSFATNTSSPGFHAVYANRDAASCASCHPPEPASGLGPSCSECHALPPGVASWAVNCVMCHGGANGATGAPPRATWAHRDDPARVVGAHAKHLASSLSAAIACGACHETPADAFSPGHLGEGPAEVSFQGLARAGGASPQWDRQTATCAATYCHGNYSGAWEGIPYEGSRATAGWLEGPMTCASCHDDPPGGEWHSPSHGSGLAGDTACELCHPNAAGSNLTGGRAITNRALHIDGKVDVEPRVAPTCFGGGCHD